MNSYYLVRNLLTKKFLMNHTKKKERDQRGITMKTMEIGTIENLKEDLMIMTVTIEAMIEVTMTVWIEMMEAMIENHEIMIVNAEEEAEVDVEENHAKRRIILSIQIPTSESSI